MKIDTAKTALLIVDMQKYQACAGGNLPRYIGLVYGADAEAAAVSKGREVVGVVAELLSAFRSAGMKVAYIAFGSLKKDGTDLAGYAQLWNERCRAMLGIPVIVDVTDPGYAVIDEIAPLPGEPVVNKTAQGAFLSSGIDALLKQWGIETVVIAGMYTNHCVLATCIGAADAGYKVYVPTDAVGTWDEQIQQRTIQMLRSWIIPTSSADVIRTIGRSAGKKPR